MKKCSAENDDRRKRDKNTNGDKIRCGYGDHEHGDNRGSDSESVDEERYENNRTHAVADDL